MDDANSKRPKRPTGELVIFNDGFILGRLVSPNASTLATRTITARLRFQKEAAVLLEKLAKGDPFRHEPQWWMANFASLFSGEAPAQTLEREAQKQQAELLSAFMEAHGLPGTTNTTGDKKPAAESAPEGAPPAKSCAYGQSAPAVRRAKGKNEYSLVSAKGGALRTRAPKAFKKDEWSALQNAVCEVGARVTKERAQGTHKAGTLFGLAKSGDWHGTAKRVSSAAIRAIGEWPGVAKAALSNWPELYPAEAAEAFDELHQLWKRREAAATTWNEACAAAATAAWLRFCREIYLVSQDLADPAAGLCGLESAAAALMFHRLSPSPIKLKNDRTALGRGLEILAAEVCSEMEGGGNETP